MVKKSINGLDFRINTIQQELECCQSSLNIANDDIKKKNNSIISLKAEIESLNEKLANSKDLNISYSREIYKIKNDLSHKSDFVKDVDLKLNEKIKKLELELKTEKQKYTKYFNTTSEEINNYKLTIKNLESDCDRLKSCNDKLLTNHTQLINQKEANNDELLMEKVSYESIIQKYKEDLINEQIKNKEFIECIHYEINQFKDEKLYIKSNFVDKLHLIIIKYTNYDLKIENYKEKIKYYEKLINDEQLKNLSKNNEIRILKDDLKQIDSLKTTIKKLQKSKKEIETVYIEVPVHVPVPVPVNVHGQVIHSHPFNHSHYYPNLNQN